MTFDHAAACWRICLCVENLSLESSSRCSGTMGIVGRRLVRGKPSCLSPPFKVIICSPYDQLLARTSNEGNGSFIGVETDKIAMAVTELVCFSALTHAARIFRPRFLKWLHRRTSEQFSGIQSGIEISKCWSRTTSGKRHVK